MPSSPEPRSMPTIYSAVPGRQPIPLVSYYSEFKDYYHLCELQTKRWFVENVASDWVIFDVGANVGYYSILFSQLAPHGRVLAFEPTATARMLEANLRAQGCRNVEMHEMALGARSGLIEDGIYRIWGEEPERAHYPFRRLDDVVTDFGMTRVDCIKIDVDSFDLEVLFGAERTLERFDPWIVVELNHALAKRQQSVGQVIGWLLGRGYRGALLLDHENYVMRRASPPARGPGHAAGFLVDLDSRPIFLPPTLAKDVPLPGLLMPRSVRTTPPVSSSRLRGARPPDWSCRRRAGPMPPRSAARPRSTHSRQPPWRRSSCRSPPARSASAGSRPTSAAMSARRRSCGRPVARRRSRCRSGSWRRVATS